MKLAMSWRHIVVVSICACAGVAFHFAQMRQAIVKQEAWSFSVLSASVSSLFSRALKAHDDLAAQEIRNTLLKTPGIVAVQFSEPDRLTVEGSTYRRQQLLGKLFVASSAFFGAMGVLCVLYLEIQAKRTRAMAEELKEIDVQLKETSRQKGLAENRSQRANEERHELLRLLLDYVPLPLIVLDAKQRIAGMSRAAEGVLQVGESDSGVGKSWHEIGMLAEGGKILESALGSDHAEGSWRIEAKDLTLRAKPYPVRTGGTWIVISVE